MPSQEEQFRLNKYLALQLGISRREADDYISKGEVRINEETATLGARILASDTITVKGAPIHAAVGYKYLLFNKPTGYVCSRKQQGDNPTIYDLIPPKYATLKPVGRLDKDSSGLIILTNDGDFAFQMTHPKFYKVKIYAVELDRDLEPLHQQMISDHGVILEDGPSKFELEKITDNQRNKWHITMSEGRNRQIRRTFAALGYTVVALHRTHFGAYTLDEVSPGSFIETEKR